MKQFRILRKDHLNPFPGKIFWRGGGLRIITFLCICFQIITFRLLLVFHKNTGLTPNLPPLRYTPAPSHSKNVDGILKLDTNYNQSLTIALYDLNAKFITQVNLMHPDYQFKFNAVINFSKIKIPQMKINHKR